MKRSNEIDLTNSWIEIFDQTVGEYLALLYAAFPVRIDLEAYAPELSDLKDSVLMISSPPYRKSIDWLEENRMQIAKDLSGEEPGDAKIATQGKKYFDDIARFHLHLPEAIKIREKYEELSEVRSETTHWLVESGYINVEKQRKVIWSTSIRWNTDDGVLHDHYAYKGGAPYIVFEGARLTSKGLEVLRAIPSVLEEDDQQKSFGEQLVEQTKGVALDTRQASVRKIVGEIIGVGLKLFG